jgi:hypothetical protein
MLEGSLTGSNHTGKPLHMPVYLLDSLAMISSTSPCVRSCSRPPGSRWPARTAIFTATLTLSGLIGCSSEEDIPPAVVKPVTAYGLTLDNKATPQEVAFVLLRSIADDVKAAQAYDTKAQKTSLRITHSLAACNTIAARLGLSDAQAGPSSSKAGLRDRKLYAFVKDWAPIVAHYVSSFDTDPQAAARRMEVRGRTQKSLHIYYDVSHDPAETDPAKRQTTTIDIELVQEQADGLSYWRVAKVVFAPPKPRVQLSPATRTAPASAPHG